MFRPLKEQGETQLDTNALSENSFVYWWTDGIHLHASVHLLQLFGVNIIWNTMYRRCFSLKYKAHS